MMMLNISRIEVIDHTKDAHFGGERRVVQNNHFNLRLYKGCEIDMQFEVQDEGRTLKIFLGDAVEDEESCSIDDDWSAVNPKYEDMA